jgi:pseudaminic acid synthase
VKIKISKNLIIGDNYRPVLIAEISGNHGGDKKKFLDHIKKAKIYGADMVKIQTYEPEDIVLKQSIKNLRISKGVWKNKNLFELYENAHTPFEWHYDAFKLAKKIKIPLFSTPFSIRSLEFLKKFNPSIYKISSFEITDHNLIYEMSKIKKPIILSTGLSNIDEIKDALKIINKFHNKIIILHCVSGYPTPPSDVNLNSITFLKNEFKKNLIGLSDHTNDIFTSVASISLGVNLIEKHFKTSDKIKSEDSSFSINKKNLLKLKKYIINIHPTLGLNTKKIQKSEKQNLIFRRSIYAIKNIKKNDKFSKKNIRCYRPAIGLPSNLYLNILNKKSKSNIKKFSPILKKHLDE